MAIKKTYELTQAGLEELKAELVDLKEVKIKENLEALKEARAQGDLSENADYDAARDEQARIAARIQEIENIIKNVKIIKANEDSTSVNIGKEVVLYFIDKDKEVTYHLVGTIEADPIKGKISVESPLGRAIKGREVGDIVTVKSETGKSFNVRIVSLN